MAKRNKQKSVSAKSSSTDAELARQAAKTRRRADASRAAADLAHRQSEQAHITADGVHKTAEAVHSRVHSLEEEMRQRAKSSTGIARPPKTGASPPKKAGRGSPVLPATSGAQPESKLPFTVVGVGASAGGYEAYTTFLSNLPKDTGMAFVLVQHLDPSHASHLPELLAKVSSIPINEIKNGAQPQPNQAYVIPPNTTVTLSGGRFKLATRDPARAVSMPIDVFFRSLAMEQQNRAIGIVLSGSGTDGTLGVAEIKGEGGITFAQEPATAKHFGMPGSAIAAGNIDFVMAPVQIAHELARLSDHPYVASPKADEKAHRPVPQEPVESETLLRETGEEMRLIFLLLRTRTGVDFSLYKPGTLNRRIMRRMVLRKVDGLGRYLKFLQETPGEVDALFSDLLISVTGFFRDPDFFHALQKKILPRLLRRRPAGLPLRIWSCGCSTGEEAYSLAIVVSEFLEKANQDLPVQIFASDLNERGIEKARAGVYHENILLDVSPERLRRFFVKVDGFYQVTKSIRDLCVFARQNVVMDPPFSNLDLISCRNVLIYLTPVLQKRVFPIFHYALKPSGFLLLGSSETTGDSSELFNLTDKEHKIYEKKAAAYRPTVDVSRFGLRDMAPAAPRAPAPKEDVAVDLQEKVDRLILNRYSPTGVVINAQMDVVQFRGQTGGFLEHHQGNASLNLLKMVREELVLDVRRAVNKAVQTGQPVEQRAIQIPSRRGPERDVIIEVQPLSGPADADPFFVVLFHDVTPEGAAAGGGKAEAARKKHEAGQIATLKTELAATKESLQAIIEEQDATNEELKSANEEIQSSNEELQSTNEELETAREELQSTNEELTTLNQELQNRNSELAYLNNDLTNLLNNINIAVIILGTDLKIRRFTTMAEKLFNLIPSDVGRRLTDLARKIEIPDLEESIADVTENLVVVEREVQDREGSWYALRIRPYRTQDSRIEGAVLMLLDIEELKRAMVQMVGIVRHPLLLLYEDLTVSRANDAFYRAFGVIPEETENKRLYELGNGQWDIPKLRELLENVLPKQVEVRDFLVEHDFPNVGRRKFAVNARRFYGDDRGIQRIAVAFEDITERP